MAAATQKGTTGFVIIHRQLNLLSDGLNVHLKELGT